MEISFGPQAAIYYNYIENDIYLTIKIGRKKYLFNGNTLYEFSYRKVPMIFLGYL